MTSRRAGATGSRRGLVIIPAMICLVLAALICGALLKLASTQRSTVRAEEQRAQAEWLAESGAARAAARLGTDRRYRGESWEIGAEALGGRPGLVKVEVETPADHPARRRVRVEADYPRGSDRRARVSKTVTLELGPETPGGSS